MTQQKTATKAVTEQFFNAVHGDGPYPENVTFDGRTVFAGVAEPEPVHTETPASEQPAKAATKKDNG